MLRNIFLILFLFPSLLLGNLPQEGEDINDCEKFVLQFDQLLQNDKRNLLDAKEFRDGFKIGPNYCLFLEGWCRNAVKNWNYIKYSPFPLIIMPIIFFKSKSSLLHVGAALTGLFFYFHVNDQEVIDCMEENSIKSLIKWIQKKQETNSALARCMDSRNDISPFLDEETSNTCIALKKMISLPSLEEKMIANCRKEKGEVRIFCKFYLHFIKNELSNK